MGTVQAVQARAAAARFMKVYAPGMAADGLPQLVDDCAAHLVSLGLEPEEAGDLAIKAWGDVEGPSTGCHIDLEGSTRNVVFIVDPVAGDRRAVLLVDLVRLLGPREVAPARRTG